MVVLRDGNEARYEPRISSLSMFCAVAEEGSFSLAAARLGVTQPAVSQQIKRLEVDYGTKLLHRNASTVVPTEDGSIVYGYATQIVHLYQRSKQALHEARSRDVSGTLTIGASTGLGEFLLPTALARFVAEYPNAHLSMHVGDSNEILDRILQHRSEIGFVGVTRRDNHLRFDPFICDRLVLTVPPTDDLARHRSIDLNTFVELPLILQQPGSGATAALSAALSAEGVCLADLNIVMECGLQESTKTAVRSGLGATVISRLGIVGELCDQTLVEIEVEGLGLQHDFHVAYHRDWPPTRLADAFVRYARKVARQHQ